MKRHERLILWLGIVILAAAPVVYLLTQSLMRGISLAFLSAAVLFFRRSLLAK